MGSEIIQDEEAMKRIEELVVSDRSSTMLVCVQGTEEGSCAGKFTAATLRTPYGLGEWGIWC